MTQPSLFDQPSACPSEIPYGHCHCGCGQRTRIAAQTSKRDGHVKGAPVRYICGHYPPRWAPSQADYCVEWRGYSTACWIWQRAISGGTGYGTVGGSHGFRGLAHRLYYEHHVGPITEGLVIDHLCRVRACVNPVHLEPVSPAQNIQRGAGAKLTPEQVEQIRASTEPHTVLGLRYGVHRSQISKIKSGKKWGELRAA